MLDPYFLQEYIPENYFHQYAISIDMWGGSHIGFSNDLEQDRSKSAIYMDCTSDSPRATLLDTVNHFDNTIHLFMSDIFENVVFWIS